MVSAIIKYTEGLLGKNQMILDSPPSPAELAFMKTA